MEVQKTVTGLVTLIVGIVVIFYLVGGMSDVLTDSADNISNSGLPLASLFSSSGVVMIIFMVSILLGIIFVALKMKKH